MGLFDFLKSTSAPAGNAETETVRRIVDSLDRLEQDRARYLAAFAYVLSRVARADLKVSSDETRAMERIIVEHGGLTQDQAIIVVEIAKHQNLFFGGTEDFLVTREFDRIATQEEKMTLLDCLFAVAAAESLVSVAEENEIKKIVGELGLSHADYISVRSSYRDRLAVMQKPE